jgi:hypothetical protein
VHKTLSQKKLQKRDWWSGPNRRAPPSKCEAPVVKKKSYQEDKRSYTENS